MRAAETGQPESFIAAVVPALDEILIAESEDAVLEKLETHKQAV